MTKWVLAALLCAVSTTASAQVFTGRIDMTVLDSTGAVLPGVTVAIAGPQNQTTVTDGQGQAHLLNLPAGTYEVKATLQGFSPYLNKTVPVGAGAAVPLRVTMTVQGVAEQVQVAGETPILEPKRQTVSTNITIQELQNIPSARDPWVVLQTVPGVVLDRVNVGGSESGQQSNYIAKGATIGDNTWYMDGIPITDMSALGGSPSYYDFDMFQEMQVTTGGADAQQATAGVQMNFVLKSGSNTPHGSARTYYENKRLQGDNLPSDLVAALGGASGKGNRTTKYADYGGELGGPLVRDRLWGWGSLGRTDVNIQTLSGFPDATKLIDVAAKAQAAFSQALRANFTFFSGNKKKDGRGAGPFNPPETTWIQNGPSKMYKAEANYVASSALFLTARAAHVNGPFTLTPKGGLDNGQLFIDGDGVFHNSTFFQSNDRPQIVLNGDGNWFHGRHEVRFGVSLRHYTDDNVTRYPGDFEDVEIQPNVVIAIPIRPYHQINRAIYTSAYVGDSVSLDRLTLTGSLRFDRTTDSAGAVDVPAHPLVPDVLPAVHAAEIKNAIVWNTLSPRVGLAYAAGRDRKTIARASYSAFASQLNATTAGNVSTASFAYAYYLAVDRNHNFNIEPSELGTFLFAKNINPVDPNQPVNQIASDFSAPRTHEITAGVDHELFANFAVSAVYTWRRYVNQLWNQLPPIGATSADYVEDGRLTGTLPDGSSYDVPYFALKESAAPIGAGTITSNRKGYHRSYNGVELAATKRLAQHWMGRFGFSWNRSREYFDNPSTSIVDPTPITADPQVNGGIVTVPTAGTNKSQIYLTLPTYQFIANGYYQGPWGVNLGGNYVMRQGYSEMFFSNDVGTNDPVYQQKDIVVIAGRIGQFRLPNVHSLDVRIEKTLTLQRTRVGLDFDVFNVLNRGTVLGRIYDVSSSKFNQVAEIMNPRIARFGVRVQF
jgi:Carboxypeptidase regulatory-like domain/TonB-dependent Receptor Plug Domain